MWEALSSKNKAGHTRNSFKADHSASVNLSVSALWGSCSSSAGDFSGEEAAVGAGTSAAGVLLMSDEVAVAPGAGAAARTGVSIMEDGEAVAPGSGLAAVVVLVGSTPLVMVGGGWVTGEVEGSTEPGSDFTAVTVLVGSTTLALVGGG